MPKTGQDVVFYAGNSRPWLRFTYTIDGAPVNLTGALVKWWMGKKPTSAGADLLLSKSSAPDDGIVIVDAAAGVFEVRFTADDTKAKPTGVWYHEAEVTLPDGPVTVATGRFDLRPTLSPNP